MGDCAHVGARVSSGGMKSVLQLVGFLLEASRNPSEKRRYG